MKSYLYLNNLVYGLAKHTFWERVQEEFRSVWDTVKDFLLMIKEYTWDIIADKIGGDMAGIILVGLLAIGVMIILMAVINR